MTDHLSTVTLYTKTPSRNRPDLAEQVGNVEKVSWSIGLGFGCVSLVVFILQKRTDWQIYIVAALLTLAISLLIRGIFTWHMAVLYAMSIVEEEQIEEYAQPRQIPTNHGRLQIRPDTAVTVTHGHMSINPSKSTLVAMERLYRQREGSRGQQISRDEIGMNGQNDEYNKLVSILSGVGYLDENKRYTGVGIRWLLLDSYYPPAPSGD